jgi:hypothetical protein
MIKEHLLICGLLVGSLVLGFSFGVRYERSRLEPYVQKSLVIATSEHLKNLYCQEELSRMDIAIARCSLDLGVMKVHLQAAVDGAMFYWLPSKTVGTIKTIGDSK